MKRRTLIYAVVTVIVLGGGYLLNPVNMWGLRRSKNAGDASVGSHLEWKEIVCHEGGYRVQMPGNPIQREEPAVAWPGVEIKVRSWKSEGSELPALFLVFHFDAPIDPDDVEQVLDHMAKQIASGKKGKLVAAKKLDFEGHPGREAVIEFTGPGGVSVQTCRFFLGKGRLYHASVVTSKEGAAAHYVANFLDSFRLIGKEGQ